MIRLIDQEVVMKPSAKKLFILLLVLLSVLLFHPALFAQQESIIAARFKDGSVIYGRVLEMNAEKISIQKSNGEIVVRPFNDVEELIRGNKAIDRNPTQQRHTWEFGPEISFVEYKEPGVMSEKGTMFGLGASYAYHDDMMLKFEGRFSYGKADYENSGTMDNVTDLMYEFRGVVGYDFEIFKATTLTPFIGFGVRYLSDDSGGRTTSTGEKGYMRRSIYYYSPIGIETNTLFSKGWSVGVAAEYDYFWKGQQNSALSDANPNYNDQTNNQYGGYGLRGSIRIKKQSDERYYVVEPFIRYWEIDQSDNSTVTYSGVIIGYGYEPKNRSTEIGLKFGIGF